MNRRGQEGHIVGSGSLKNIKSNALNALMALLMLKQSRPNQLKSFPQKQHSLCQRHCLNDYLWLKSESQL